MDFAQSVIRVDMRRTWSTEM